MAHYGLSLVAYRQCHLKLGIEEASQAVLLDNTSSKYRVFLAELYAADGRTEEAEAILSDLMAASPKDWEAHLRASSFLYAMGDYDTAERELQQVLAGESNLFAEASFVHELMGKLYYDQDDLAKARHEYRISLAALPSNSAAQAMLGDIAQREAEPSVAMQEYELAEAMLPTYRQFMLPDSVALLEVSLTIRRRPCPYSLGPAGQR